MPMTYIGTRIRKSRENINLNLFHQRFSIKPKHIIKQHSENGTESWMYIKQLRHSNNEIAHMHKQICNEMFLVEKWNKSKYWMNIKNKCKSSECSNLLHFWLSTVIFNLFSNISSTSSMFWMTRTMFRCVKVEAITKKQNAQNPEKRLYESMSCRTKFLLSALMSWFDIHKWNIE